MKEGQQREHQPFVQKDVSEGNVRSWVQARVPHGVAIHLHSVYADIVGIDTQRSSEPQALPSRWIESGKDETAQIGIPSRTLCSATN